jgi:hypothetical protein
MVQTKSGRSLIFNPAITAWLTEQYGPPPRGTNEWYLNLENDTYKWFYRGQLHSEPGQPHSFYFRTEDQALMFKLTWGGL